MTSKWMRRGLACAAYGLMGCASLNQLGLTPTLKFNRVSFSDASFDGVVANFEFKLTNPYPVALPIGRYSYKVQLDGQEFVTGEQASAQPVGAGQTGTFNVPVRLEFARVFQTLRAVGSKSSVTVGLRGDVGVNTPAGTISLPISATASVPILKPPVPRLPRAKVLGISGTTVNLELAFAFDNPNAIALTASDTRFDLSFDARHVGNGVAGGSTTFPANGSGEMKLQCSANLASLAATLADLAIGHGPAYELTGQTGMETTFGTLNLPFRLSGNLPLGAR